MAGGNSLAKNLGLKIQDKLLFFLNRGKSGAFLFVAYVPTLPA
jgi:hypothetical protein